MPQNYVRDISVHLGLSALGVGVNYLINQGWVIGLISGLVIAAFITGVLRQREGKASAGLTEGPESPEPRKPNL